ncbi:MAG: T9SS type A sorting domain-containing protein, partial [Phaeodactylibacter sp.]|nr:T9SS type A sorting domain-containing protein [Phaeodactylibacter sp.]
MDCDDSTADINPDAEEVLDSLDNNCNGMIDEGLVASVEKPAGQWAIFPNPTGGYLFIKGELPARASFRVIDINGRVVWENTFQSVQNEVMLNLNTVLPGVYVLECRGDGGQQIFVQRILRL